MLKQHGAGVGEVSWKGRCGHRRGGRAVGNLPSEKSRGVGLSSFALVLKVKLLEGRAGSVLFTAVPADPRPELRRHS